MPCHHSPALCERCRCAAIGRSSGPRRGRRARRRSAAQRRRRPARPARVGRPPSRSDQHSPAAAPREASCSEVSSLLSRQRRANLVMNMHRNIALQAVCRVASTDMSMVRAIFCPRHAVGLDRLLGAVLQDGAIWLRSKQHDFAVCCHRAASSIIPVVAALHRTSALASAAQPPAGCRISAQTPMPA